MRNDDASDAALMQRYASGEGAAFEVLYRRHELRVWRYLVRSVRSRAAADDLMQDVWFAVAREASRYRPTAKFTTWLFTIAHHRLIDWMRSNRPQNSLEALGEEAAEVHERLTADVGSEPSAAAHASEQASALLRALGALPPEQRMAFLLQAESGLSVEEIAAISASTFETTKSRLRYARTKLRALLREYA
jgi:RNA polymerase sigma factor (sigma-70 family)